MQSLIVKNTTKLINDLFKVFLKEIEDKVDEETLDIIKTTLNESLEIKIQSSNTTKKTSGGGGEGKVHGNLNNEIKRVLSEEIKKVYKDDSKGNLNTKVSGTFYRFLACCEMKSDKEKIEFIESTTNVGGEKRSGKFKNEHKLVAQNLVCSRDDNNDLVVYVNSVGKEIPEVDIGTHFKKFVTFCKNNEDDLLRILNDDKNTFKVDDGGIYRAPVITKRIIGSREKKKVENIDDLLNKASEKKSKKTKVIEEEEESDEEEVVIPKKKKSKVIVEEEESDDDEIVVPKKKGKKKSKVIEEEEEVIDPDNILGELDEE